MFSLPILETTIFDLDNFEISPNLILFDFDSIAPSSGFLPIRQSPRHTTPSPIPISPRHKVLSPIRSQLAQLNWVPFVDISPRDFDSLLCHGSKRKLLEEPLPDYKRNKEVIPHDKPQSRKINSKSKTRLTTQKHSRI